MAEAAAEDLKETLLAGEHRALGARMVPFAGYAMPVQYPTGIIAEHTWTREHAGLFDVSHMGPAFPMLRDRSGDADTDHAAIAALIEPLVSGDIRGLKPGQMRYTLLLTEQGGILDDLMIGRPSDTTRSGALYVVVNAGTKDADFAIIAGAAGQAAELKRSDNSVLLALQGPEAVDVMRDVVPAATELGFMTYSAFPHDDTRLFVSRSGYTGEDGFEILVPPQIGVAFWRRLLGDARVKPIGLGARDSLRLEAGLPLYGHDIDETTSPIEADLAFAVAKRRRLEADLPGAERIDRELFEGPLRRRVGLLPEGKAPVRDGAEIKDMEGALIGKVTSGGYGPTVGAPIAMGYVERPFAIPGTSVLVNLRGKNVPAKVAPLPFVPHRYFRKDGK